MESEKLISINPPPANGCCDCCKKNISEITPFGKAGDPLVGDFDGSILVKTFRTMAPSLTDKEMQDYIKKNGEENGNFYDQLMNTVEAAWLCRDCIILNDDDYFNKLKEVNNK